MATEVTKKVYVIISGYYYSFEILGIYTNRDTAVGFCNLAFGKSKGDNFWQTPSRWWVNIEEYPLND